MRNNIFFLKCFFADPLALAVACIISLLVVHSAYQFLNSTKRNNDSLKSQVVCFQSPDDSPTEIPNDRWLEKLSAQKFQNNNCSLAVTFTVPLTYGGRLTGSFYELSQPPAWLPSIPVAHRKLII